MLTIGSHPSGAVDLESLVSPGELFAAHAKEIRECADCHESFERGGENDRCIKCHEPVGQDLNAGQGFHGRIGDPAAVSCRSCHTEHKGADADIVGFVPESFDHQRTDFALDGAHASVACTGCHESGKLYREAPVDCTACHGDEDPHKGRLGERCQDCHQPASWRQVEFDHAKTRFPLEGRHADAACALCHPRQRFKETAMKCVSCHRVDDVHRGRLGPKCEACHDSGDWKQSPFDHARETRFALEGRHAALACNQCHESDPKVVKVSTDCRSCHAADDDHQGRRGDACEKCHGTRDWKTVDFDHTTRTEFPLRGSHEKLACDLCHVGTLYAQKTPARCVSCHEIADVHEGTAGDDCGKCHRESSWREVVHFDHDLTAFPLLALHQLATCEDCHVSRRFREAGSTCVECHGRADVHERTLGGACALCHNPNGWERWRFDHATQTEYALEGAHENLQCRACHTRAVDSPATTARFGSYIELSSRCRSCHLRDSPHEDAFGRDCERCHVDTSWKEIERKSQ